MHFCLEINISLFYHWGHIELRIPKKMQESHICERTDGNTLLGLSNSNSLLNLI